MKFLRSNFLPALLAGGTILSTLIPLIIILILWFWARNAISTAIEGLFPGQLGQTITNIVFGVLALYFIIKLLGRFGGR